MKKFVTFGEIMLRLKSPGYDRLFQQPSLEATFGGGEANVAVSLANYGLDAKFVTALPANDIRPRSFTTANTRRLPRLKPETSTGRKFSPTRAGSM